MSWAWRAPRDSNPNLQIRRSGRIVQDRPLLVVRWADVSHQSAIVSRCPVAWQQYWQQPRARGVDLVTVRALQGMARVRSGQAPALFVMSLVKAASRALLSAEGYQVERALAVLDR